MKGALIFFIFISSFLIHSQPKKTLNERIEELHFEFQSNIHKDAVQAQKDLDSLAVYTKIPLGNFYFKFNSGYFFFVKHNFVNAKENYIEATAIAQKNALHKEYVEALIWLANLAYFDNDHLKASENYEKALVRSLAIDYTDGICTAWFGKATLENDDEKKLKWLLQIDSLYKIKGKASAVLANSYEVIGRIYFNALDHKELAQFYFEKCLAVSKEVNYVPGIMQSNRMMGKMAIESGAYDKAYYYLNSILSESIKLKDTVRIASSLVEIASVDEKSLRLKSAQKRLMYALLLYKAIDDSISLTKTHLTTANTYIKARQFDIAEMHLDSAKQISKSLDTLTFKIEYAKAHLLLLEAKSNYKEALLTSKLIDSLTSIDIKRKNSKAFLEMEQRYQSNEKAKEIRLLTTEKELANQQRINQRNVFIAGGSVLGLALLGLFFLYRNKQKTHAKLQELDTLKSNFFANISHEFRTPLTLISSPISAKLENDKLSKKDRESFEMIQRNNNRLLGLVDQLLDLSKIDGGTLRLQVSEGNPFQLISTLADSFTYMSTQSKVTYHRDITKIESALSWFDPDIITKVSLNLLSNAFKYTPEGGVITLSATHTEKGELLLEVRNTNTTLSDVQLASVFERFYQGNAQAEGAGIGLSLVKELVTIHKGSIKASRTEEGIIVFSAVFPIEKANYTAVEFADIKTPQPVVEMVMESSNFTYEAIEDEETPILLIVEDNPDVRKLLYDNFNIHYNVITASDGEEGITKALEYIPDIIISDVMMPVKDGITLTQTLKTDERTSHIPIVLLTARAGEAHELEGIETGADDYITKPFSTKLLTSKVSKLIALRKQLQERYSQEVILQPKDVAVTSMDEQFLMKVQQIMDRSLIESSFNVEEFSKAVGMSRMQLHRKLKALTGLSASEFVRSQRLKLAASLLKKSDINVSQVGYSVGFNDHSYFTKCFRELYNMTPSEYAKSK